MALTLETALKLIHAVVAAGREQGVPVAVAVVDTGGRVVASARAEQAGFIHLGAAERKAVSAVTFRAPTDTVLDMVKSDPVLLGSVTADPSLLLLPGGFPVVIGGECVGALGIAGGHYSQDQAIGTQALKVL